MSRGVAVRVGTAVLGRMVGVRLGRRVEVGLGSSAVATGVIRETAAVDCGVAIVAVFRLQPIGKPTAKMIKATR